MSNSGNTVRLHRVLRASPKMVFKAFTDPNAMARWLPPRGFTARVEHVDARPGGSHRASFTDFATGHTHHFGGEFLEVVENEKLRYTDRFDDPNLPGEMTVTVTFKKVSCGTELDVVQEGIPDMIPLDACYLGWQDSLMFLALLVEGHAGAPEGQPS